MVIVFALLALTVLVTANWYLWRRLFRDTTRGPGRARRLGAVLIGGGWLLAVGALVAERTGAPFWLQRVLAWPGFLWLALSVYLLLAVIGSDTDTWPRLLLSTMMIGLSGYLGALAARNHWSQAEAQAALSSTLARLATLDHLTGGLNRRAFDSRLSEEVDQAHRLGTGLSVLIVDVDHFKHVNDSHGHLVGDSVLSGVSAALRDACRPGDIVGRIGGDEFGLILPDTTGEVAAAVGERLRLAVRDLPLPVRVTLSIGAAQLTRDVDSSLRLLQAADLALYDVKSAGRDAVALHRDAATV